MANNRMVLVCNVCVPEKDGWKSYSDKGVLAIAKWYPGGNGAYYFRGDYAGWARDVEEFFITHAHPTVPSQGYSAGAGQPNPVRIEYESVDLPIKIIEHEDVSK